jgi:colicin import membrane protein
MWKVVRENPRAVIYAVLMHLVLLALLMISLDWTPTATKTGGTQPVQAELVDQKQLKAIEDRKLVEQRKAEQQVKQKAEAERKRKAEEDAKQKAEVERKRKADQAAKQKVEAERKRKADQVAKQKAETERKRKAEEVAKQKAEAERKRKAEQVAKQKAEAERKAKAEAARQQEAERVLQAEVAAEQQREQQARDQGVVSEYVSYIQEKVRRNWIRPAGSSEDFTCTVQVSLIPGGDVARVNVVQSCGDVILDRSIESAVFKAAPLPVPPDSGLFHYFRELKFVFRP